MRLGGVELAANACEGLAASTPLEQDAGGGGGRRPRNAAAQRDEYSQAHFISMQVCQAAMRKLHS